MPTPEILDREGAITVRQMIESDAGEIVMKLAETDRRELEMMGVQPFDVMRAALSLRPTSYTGCVDGKPEAVFGVNIKVNPVSIWFLGSDRARENARDFHKISKRWVELMARNMPLANVVPEVNTTTIRWLKALDFEFEDRVYTINGHRFLRFYRGPSTHSLPH
jgi:hypothetical protein